ncbi:MAG TPA: SCO family protein, partial [Dyella sp.]|nr:SCO family protein [Dyella sp.]
MKLLRFARLAALSVVLCASALLTACQRHDSVSPWQLTDISGHMPDLMFQLTDDQSKSVTAA